MSIQTQMRTTIETGDAREPRIYAAYIGTFRLTNPDGTTPSTDEEKADAVALYMAQQIEKIVTSWEKEQIVLVSDPADPFDIT